MPTASRESLKVAWGAWVEGWRAVLDYEQVPDLEPFLASFTLSDVGGETVEFRLNSVQQRLAELIEDLEARGIPVRVIILKARQEGVSTFVIARIFEKIVRRAGQKALIIADDEENTKELYRSRLLSLWNQIPKAARPETVASTAMELVIEHGAKEEARGERPKPGRKGVSQVQVQTAGKKEPGRSRNPQHIHLSEFAFFRNQKGTLKALLPGLHRRAGTSLIIETTGNGAGGLCYEIWQKAKKGENEFIPVFFPWFAHAEYSLPFETDEERRNFLLTLKPDELDEMVRYGLSAEQMKWWKWNVANNAFGDELIARIEYPWKDSDAFVATGTCRFDLHALAKCREKLVTPIAVGEPVPAGLEKYTFSETKRGLVTLYRRPVPGREYLIGADTAEGRKVLGDRYEAKEDFSAACVYERKSRRLMARIHARIDPEDYGNVLNRLGRYFNEALIVAENNSVGIALMIRLRQLGYPRIYRTTVLDSAALEKQGTKAGWTMTEKSRNAALTALSSEILKERLEVCAEQLRELENFVMLEDGYRWEAGPGFHDDEVMALAMVCAVNRMEGYELLPDEVVEEKPKPRHVRHWEATARGLGREVSDGGIVDEHMGSDW